MIYLILFVPILIGSAATYILILEINKVTKEIQDHKREFENIMNNQTFKI